MFKRESTLKRHSSTVKHLLEEKKMKIVTGDLEQSISTTLWTTIDPEVRYPSYIDHIDSESCAPVPTCKYVKTPLNSLLDKPKMIPLEKNGETFDPRPRHVIYCNIQRPLAPETPALYATGDTPDTHPFIIENNEKC